MDYKKKFVITLAESSPNKIIVRVRAQLNGEAKSFFDVLSKEAQVVLTHADRD